MTTLGYARVSTADQDLAAQLEALTAAGAERIYREKMSGAKADRPELNALLATIQAGDVLVVTKLDRLARSTLDLLTILQVVDKRGAKFRSLHEALDTSTPVGRLITQVLAIIAEFERERILERTTEGRQRARAAGKRLGGRKPENQKMTPAQRILARSRVLAGEPRDSVAESYGVSVRTIDRLSQKPAQGVPPAPCSAAGPVQAPSSKATDDCA